MPTERLLPRFLADRGVPVTRMAPFPATSPGRLVPPAHADDLELVRRHLAGDRAASDRLGDRLACVGRMLRARGRAWRGGLSEHDLLDCAQNVLAKLLARLRDYEGRAALESWAFAFCEGELRNLWRRWQKQDALAAGAEAEAVDVSAPPETFEDLAACLDRLARDEGQLVRAKHFDGLSLEALAARAAQNLNTIKSRYYRALLQLRQCLQRRGEAGAHE